MAGWLGGKYGHYSLHEMVETDFRRLWTKFKLAGATLELTLELHRLNEMYKPFLNCACDYNKKYYNDNYEIFS